nr:putative ribonuclease h protein [Quercus suber]
MGNPGMDGGGGLIRNESGEWVKGYARAIDYATSVVVELWVLKDGIQLCISLKVPALVVELDAKLVVDLLKKDVENLNDADADTPSVAAKVDESGALSLKRHRNGILMSIGAALVAFIVTKGL